VLFLDFGMLGGHVHYYGMSPNFFEDSNGLKEIFPAISCSCSARKGAYGSQICPTDDFGPKHAILG